MLEGLRLTAAALCLVAGVIIMIVATIGVFRFHFVLNRMHQKRADIDVGKAADDHCVLLVCQPGVFASGFQTGGRYPRASGRGV